MNEKQNTNRRKFIKQSVMLGAVASLVPRLLKAEFFGEDEVRSYEQPFTILYQGDSITDGNRTRNNDWNHVMGHGYQYIIASKLWYDFPKRNLHFFNRGISGNKITDLAARWQKDTLEVKPDVLSILVGINDAFAFFNGNKDYSAVNYEKDYSALLQQTKQQLPNVKLVLCEPFILPVGKVKEKWNEYSGELFKRQQAVKRLSEEHDAIFVGFQTAFNKALSKAPAEYWIWDGIHPMPAGHELMAREWLKTVSRKIPHIK
jgi:lysophospholipase L1-like esterase